MLLRKQITENLSVFLFDESAIIYLCITLFATISPQFKKRGQVEERPSIHGSHLPLQIRGIFLTLGKKKKKTCNAIEKSENKLERDKSYILSLLVLPVCS